MLVTARDAGIEKMAIGIAVSKLNRILTDEMVTRQKVERAW